MYKFTDQSKKSVHGARATVGAGRVMALVLCTVPGLVTRGSAFAQTAGAEDAISHEMKMMDTNGDGKISADEHAAGAKQMFTTMDGNGDGKVTAAEMDAAQDKITGQATVGVKGKLGALANKKGAPSSAKPSAAEKIKAVDKNGDGSLSADEHTAGSKMMFDKMDTDHDGSLTKSELVSGHAKLLRNVGK